MVIYGSSVLKLSLKFKELKEHMFFFEIKNLEFFEKYVFFSVSLFSLLF